MINVLQDALYNGRRLTQADVDRLIDAQNTARSGSLDALNGQYARMDAARRQRDDQFLPLERAISLPAPREPRQLTYNGRQNSLPLAPAKMRALPPPTPGLFCGYSEQLQVTNRDLSPAFDPQNAGNCPVCGVHIPIDTQDYWTLTVQVPDLYGNRKPVDYEFDARLVVKSHMEDGRFACVLCNKLSSKDCVCRDVDSLVQHLGNHHTAEEYTMEPDLVQLTPASFSSKEKSKELVLRR